MSQHHIGGLPATQNGKLVGIMTESDIFRALSELLSATDGSVRITFDLTESEDVLLYLFRDSSDTQPDTDERVNIS